MVAVPEADGVNETEASYADEREATMSESTAGSMAHVTKGPHLGKGIIGESRTLHTDSLACVDHGLELVVRSLRDLTTCIHGLHSSQESYYHT